MFSASRFLHCLKIQLTVESEMFPYESNPKTLRLLPQAVASDFTASSETSQQPLMSKVSKLAQYLAKDNMVPSPLERRRTSPNNTRNPNITDWIGFIEA